MILVLRPDATEHLIEQIRSKLAEYNLDSQSLRSSERTIIMVQSDTGALPTHIFQQLDGVEKVVNLSSRTPLVADPKLGRIDFDNSLDQCRFVPENTPTIIAGPCSIEGQEKIIELAKALKAAGATMLRGGAFKPRTSPYDFSGLGKAGLEYLREARQITKLPIVSEVMSAEQVEIAEPLIDMFQIGARNMYNYELLKEVGKSQKPVLLKRAMSATIDEFLQAAEYILLQGNLQVALCERGIRSFETRTRNTLDLSAVPLLKDLTSLPVIVDPSHGTGRRDLVQRMSRAAIACGADGVMLEVHISPDQSISDSDQSIDIYTLQAIVADLGKIHAALFQRTPLTAELLPR